MLLSVFRTVIISVAVTAAMRLMGKRQLGELQPGELVTTLLISNVASICIDEPDLPLAASLAPIFLLAALEVLNSTLLWFFPQYGRLLFGSSVTVIRGGEVRQETLPRLRITAADLLEALRSCGIFSPQEVLWCAVEPNGKITVVPKPRSGQPFPMLPLLVDGTVYRDNLALLGHDEPWLDARLAGKGLARRDVLFFLSNGESEALAAKSAAPKGGTEKRF